MSYPELRWRLTWSEGDSGLVGRAVVYEAQESVIPGSTCAHVELTSNNLP